VEKRKGGRGESPRKRHRIRIEEEQRERKNRGEREKRFPKDLCANSENCKGLSVKHNYSLI
jgi:hypothetical protein